MKSIYFPNFRFNICEKILICAFLFSILYCMIDFSKECDNIKNHILRLHVIANSDTDEDQKLKINVKNRVLEDCCGYLYDNTNNIDVAKEKISSHLDDINCVIQDEIIKNGYKYETRTYFTKSYFDVRNYGNITLPAGNYDSLRIVIGEGVGKNWWCVMFPPLCLPVSETSHDIQINEVLTPKQVDIIENDVKYDIKFKIVELFEIFRNWIWNLFF